MGIISFICVLFLSYFVLYLRRSKTDISLKWFWIGWTFKLGRLAEIDVSIENEELKQAIDGCIGALPDKWRGVVLDKLVEGKESEEVCNDYQITSSNLWVIMHRAKVQLRDCLDRKWFGA